jgi:hypothetical protein
MQKFGSHADKVHEIPVNRNIFPEYNAIWERSPPQGLSEARRDIRFISFFVIDPPRGRPVGGGGGSS